VSVILDLVIYN